LKAGLREKFRKRTRSKRTLATPEVSAGPNASTLSRGSRGSLGDLKDLIGWSVQPKEQPKTQLTWSPNIDDWKALGQSLLDRTLGREPEKPKTKYEKAKIYASEKLVEVKNQLRLENIDSKKISILVFSIVTSCIIALATSMVVYHALESSEDINSDMNRVIAEANFDICTSLDYYFLFE